MSRRIAAPIALAVGVWLGLTGLSYASQLLTLRAMDSLTAGQPAWLPPVLPAGQWPVFGQWLLILAVFAAVRMCSIRGGTPPECILVGLSPLVLAAPLYAHLFSRVGFAAFPTLAGLTSSVTSGKLTFGAMIAARQYAGEFLGLIATCITATWLYLWVARGTLTPAGAD
jgi:hypothetical protein